MSRSVVASFLVSLAALGLAGASAINSGLPAVFQQQLSMPQGTGFTFQGRIEKDGLPHDGSCDLQFSLFEDSAGTVQVGTTETIASPVTVTNGLFSTVVNASGAFGSEAFSGDRRWIEVGVRCPAGSGTFTALEPLTELTPVPYATFAMDSASLGGFPAEKYARYERVILVNGGGTNTENGARLVAAMASAASVTSGRVLLLLEPGTFELSTPLAVNQGTDIAGVEGSLSIIRNTVSQPALATVSGTTLTNLTVVGSAGSGAIVEHSTGSLTLNSVSISATSAGFLVRSQAPSPSADIFVNDSSLSTTCGSGTCVGLKGAGLSRFYLEDSSISMLAIGVADFVAAIQTENYLSITGGNVTASGRNGSQGAITIDSSSLSASTELSRTSIFASGSGGLTAIRTVNTVTANQSVISVAGGPGPMNIGIDSSGSVTLRTSRVAAGGATQRIAMYLQGGGLHLIERSSVENSGSDASSPAIQVSSGSLDVRHSHIEAGSNSVPIFVQSGAAEIVHSTLYGANIGSGVECRAVTDETPTFSEEDCP